MKDTSLPLISIIVPVYNVEKYLPKCVESLIAQTYKNIEILLVDDGAKDSSGKICDEYASRDERIRVIHKKNGGLSDARNVGISEAKGEYIGLIDSDDYVDADMYSTLYDLIVKYDAGLSMCGVYHVYDGKEIEIEKDPRDFCTDTEEAMKIVIECEINSVFAVNKLYRRELFEGVKYPVGKIAEDAFVIMPILEKAKRVAFTTVQKYYYFHRENSITSRVFSKKDYDSIEAHEQNYKYICEHYPNIEQSARMRLYWSRFYVLDKMLASDNVSRDEYMPVVKYIRQGAAFIMFKTRFSKGRKLATAVLLFSVSLYRKLLLKNNDKNKRMNSK